MIKRDAAEILHDEGADALREAFDRSIKQQQSTNIPFDGSGSTGKLTALPYRWPDPAEITSRQFLFGKHYIRQSVGATVGGGGRLKTTTGLTEAIGMAAGRNLITGEKLSGPLRAWFLSGEETQTELDIRVAAICQLYRINRGDCGDRLFVQSVRNKSPRYATLDKNRHAVLNRPALDNLEAEIKAKQIDVVMIDPLISFHSINENSNEDMDLLVKEGFGAVADRTHCHIELYQHPGKPKPGQAENTVEDARGASALIWAVRSARVLTFMTPQEAEKLGIAEDERRLHIRTANGKANMGPIGKADWLKISIENMANGDAIACASPWKPPDPFKGVTTTDMHKCRTLVQGGAFRADSRSHDWVGYMVADVLNINVVRGAENDRKDLARLKQILKTWFKNKVLGTENREDENRHKREFVVPGSWSDTETEPDPEEITLQ